MPKKKYQSKSHRSRGERRISVRGVQRETPDLRKLGRAMIAFAMAQAEADAEADTQTQDTSHPDPIAPDGDGESDAS